MKQLTVLLLCAWIVVPPTYAQVPPSSSELMNCKFWNAAGELKDHRIGTLIKASFLQGYLAGLIIGGQNEPHATALGWPKGWRIRALSAEVDSWCSEPENHEELVSLVLTKIAARFNRR